MDRIRMIKDDLVYDVGMHNGDDTAYYLHLGYRVVGIEADPTLVASARERFADEIAEGRLIVLNVGVAAENGSATFYVNPEKTVWNSFNMEAAGRRGHALQSIEVQTRKFGEILEEYGVPHFLKIDIEGHDHLCIEALDPDYLPAFLSVESDHEDMVLALGKLGYQGFKSIDQQSLYPVARPPMRNYLRYHRTLNLLRDHSLLGRIKIKLAGGYDQLENILKSIRSHDDWHFADGSSGSFGHLTAGTWTDVETTCELIRHCREETSKCSKQEYQYWYDLHAKRDN